MVLTRGQRPLGPSAVDNEVLSTQDLDIDVKPAVAPGMTALAPDLVYNVVLSSTTGADMTGQMLQPKRLRPQGVVAPKMTVDCAREGDPHRPPQSSKNLPASDRTPGRHLLLSRSERRQSMSTPELLVIRLPQQSHVEGVA